MSHQRKISIIGIGYVGLTLAMAFGQKEKIIAFDINSIRISDLKNGHDCNNEYSYSNLLNTAIYFTTDPNDLNKADFHIIAVPTPLDSTNHPDLSILLYASKMVGRHLKKNDVVVYESTVYPGVTEEKCIPILEQSSKMICGKDFSVGYSPERINPGDKVHTFENTVKIISAVDKKTLDLIAKVYGQAVKGIHRVSSIKIAEATKIIENTQRDINISFMNEVALILHHCNLDTNEILSAAQTKWNFVHFKPGLVGGHCIGINSYYLAHKAMEVGYYPALILAGQKVNNNMIEHLAGETIRILSLNRKNIKNTRIGILGISYKENYPDFHDSKTIDLIKILNSYDAHILAHDPIVDYNLVKNTYTINLVDWEELIELDALVLAVAHKEYCELNIDRFRKMLNSNAVIMDVKGILDKSQFTASSGIHLWQM